MRFAKVFTSSGAALLLMVLAASWVSAAVQRPVLVPVQEGRLVMSVYHTDVRGYYGETSQAAPIARLHGWVRTDSLGRYEVRTIRPGAYPTGGIPAHIHFVVAGRAEELQFSERRGGESTFATVRPVTRDRAGVDHVVRDFRLR
ncbi:MAG: hypothetical protein HOP12_05165 [Candidatus Eisenbacteria bacterium]|uniref:Intradiol ring-cleavage dioxygenases domain-containing protein n=1 Tax=Eiseniibacteriota bacterium TaxID=2212470 RepID=A0A849SGA8_UNCEI|nr:hypothetical protein [Candidatus Eisenbacteria bacterium]